MIDYELKRSKRKTISIEIAKKCKVLVKAPYLLPKRTIDKFVTEHTDWIEKHIEIQKERNNNAPPELTEKETKELKKKAREYIVPKVNEFAEIMGLEYGDIKITSAKTRYGSCNTRTHNLCFSFRLIQKPLPLVDYVIVHELAHIVHPNHSKAFYNYIEQFMPDYKDRIKQLKKTERESL
ncbi:MAG: M48 family metallopeptidase [Clostridia bacterium]|nr:M48 family metallopeptidase [Clostridia bacterium]